MLRWPLRKIKLRNPETRRQAANPLATSRKARAVEVRFLQLPGRVSARGIAAFILTCLMVVWSFALCLAGPPPLSPPPPTPQKPVIDVYSNGVSVTDDYRWLEDAGDASVKAWSDAQSRRTRAFLDALPARKPILEHIKHFIGQHPQAFYMPLKKCGGVWYALKFEAAQDRQTIVALSSLDDLSTEKRVFDPKTLDPTGLTDVGIVDPSPDGKLIAISLSKMAARSIRFTSTKWRREEIWGT